MYPDVVVIGGGIVGCSCAYYLSQAGVRVHLVEKGALGSGTSKAGMCHLVTWHEPEVQLTFARQGIKLYEELSRELPVDIEFRKTGALSVAENPDSIPSIAGMVMRLQKWGLKCELLSADEIMKMEPNISVHISGGVYYADDAQVNPLNATLALGMGAQENGATIEPYTEVTGIELSPGRDAVEAVVTSRGRIPTSNVVNAAGTWGASIARMVGLDVPITPRRGHLVLTAPLPENMFNNKTIFSAGYLDSVKGDASIAVSSHIQQLKNGNLLLGSSRQFAGFDTSVDPKVISMMLQRSIHIFPFLRDVHAIRTWSGLRPYTPDLRSILGPVEGVQGFFMACGHEGLGITEGPITGKLISQLIRGERSEIDIEVLSPDRFARK
ncbi:MAG: FAD-binding oxidoreductase [Anaerolineaceae bacterium]|nr:FAD-binding oxidoreductase [Anaerolineaceae bacterium]